MSMFESKPELMFRSKNKPMEYAPEHREEVLIDGDYRGCRFLVVSYGTHPCAYVSTRSIRLKEKLDRIVHGGITYEGNLSHVLGEESKTRFIGWDYAHAGDYICSPLPLGNETDKKWTSEEIFKDIVDAIDAVKG